MTVFLFVTVLALLVGALLTAVRHEKFRTLGYADEVAASYVAEAGVADVVDRLMDNPGFETDLVDLPVEGRNGTYSVYWSDPASAGLQNSVNNMSGAATVRGPRGNGTVPPRSAEVVIIAKVGNVTHTSQLIVLAPATPNDASPLAATGSIYLRGQVKVDSVDSVLSGYVSGGKTVHSNSRPGTVQWTKENSSDTADFDGDVTCSCSQTTAVNLEGSQGTDYFLDTAQRAVPTITLPSIDVTAAVGDQSSFPSPSFNLSGVSTLPAGDYYTSSTVNLPDDLILEDGANLFVRGDLTVDGTIRGKGKIMVDGDVDLRGDTFVDGGNDNFISLLASGDLTISGYNGEDRLAQLAAADPALDAQLSQMDSALQNLKTALGNNNPTAAETARTELGEGTGTQLLEQLRTSVSADPAADATTRFLERKLERLSDLLGDYELVTGSVSISADSLDGTQTEGLVDYAIRRNDPDMKNTARTLLGQLSRRELGYSHFRGLLYSNGRLTVQQGVSVFGAALADDGRGGGSFDNYLVPVDGTSYTPGGRLGTGTAGSIQMREGTRLTIDRSLMQGGALGGGGIVRIASWIRR